MRRVLVSLLAVGCSLTPEEFQSELNATLCARGTECGTYEETVYCAMPEDTEEPDAALQDCYDAAAARECLDGTFECKTGYVQAPAACEAVYADCG